MHHVAIRIHRGFTLVEILIVVVILGILAALAMPQFADARGDATQSAIRADLKTVRTQISIYRSNTAVYPPSIDDLVNGGYMTAAPTHPAGGNYVYIPATGSYTSSYDASW